MDITVRIAGTDYKLKVDSEESERLTRMAANEINAMLARYDSRFTDRSLTDKLIFVTMFETKAKLQLKAKMTELATQTEELHKQTENYLDGIPDK